MAMAGLGFMALVEVKWEMHTRQQTRILLHTLLEFYMALYTLKENIYSLNRVQSLTLDRNNENQ